MIRRIAVLSSSRADYGHLYWPLKAIQAHPRLHPELILYGAHLSAEFGTTAQVVEQDGFPVAAYLETLLSSDSDIGMAKTIGLATLSLADTLGQLRPDLLFVVADRYEMLAPAAVALALRIPIAHLEGGEVSEGAIDDAVRNALTKMAHIHLAPHAQAAKRIVAMGEDPARVHVVGAPSLDHLRHSALMPRDTLLQALMLPATSPLMVVAYHPVTLAEDTTAECQALFAALDQLEGTIAFCFPNADAGSRHIMALAKTFCGDNERARLFINLPPLSYWSLLAQADLMLGNSSSGIMETPSLQLPTVNVGWRQRGRLCAANILSVEADTDTILAACHQALDAAFRGQLEGLNNPYGDGTAGQKIARILADTDLGRTLLIKPASL